MVICLSESMEVALTRGIHRDEGRKKERQTKKDGERKRMSKKIKDRPGENVSKRRRKM